MPKSRIGFDRASHRNLPLIAAATLLVSITGCALHPLTARTAAFSVAAAPLPEETMDAYQLVERTYRDVQIAHMVATYDASGFDTARLRPFLDPSDLQVRAAILDALRSYVELLASISSSTDEQLAPSMKSMSTSLQDLSANKLLAARFSASDATSVSAALNALAHVLLDRKRRRDLPGILQQTQQPIETICTLLEQDIGGPDHGGLRNQLHINYLDLIRDQKNFLASNAAALAPSDKRREILSLSKLADAELAGDHALAETRKALAQFAQTHTALAQTAAQKDVPLFQLQLSQLSTTTQQLHSFYAGLAINP